MTFTFKHPKYYKELRDAGNELAPASAVKEDLTSSGSSPARNKSDQAISSQKTVDVGDSVRPGPGQKPQAPSSKHQANQNQFRFKLQAPSGKRPNQNNKHQASSRKQQAP